MNAVFVGLNNFLSSEANVILNIVLGVGTLNGVGLNYILSCKTTADFNYVKKLYLQRQNKEQVIKMFPIELTFKAGDTIGTRLDLTSFRQLLLAIKEWNQQESYNLYRDIEKKWLIFQAFNHEKVLPAAGTTILLSYGVEFLVPNLYSNAISTGLPTLTPNLVPRLQPRHFPSDVMSLCSEPRTSLDPGSFFAIIPTLGSSKGYNCAPGHVSSIVPNSFPSFSGSVPSVFHFDVPSGDSRWATSFASRSV